MSCYYETRGSLLVRDCPEVIAILDELDVLNEEYDLEAGFYLYRSYRRSTATVTVEINFSGRCSYKFATKVEETIKKFDPYMMEPAEVIDTCDGRGVCTVLVPTTMTSTNRAQRLMCFLRH